MLLRRYYDETLAQASYLIACQATGEALVVDPLRDADLYLDAAAREGVQIAHVTETHIHADFASGSRELAARTGARLYLSALGGEDWSYRFAEGDGAILLHDEEGFQVGNIRIRALHTPGHTPEHLSFLVTDAATSEHPLGLLSGDFVFVGDVGRPDLLEKAAGVSGTMEAGARDLYRSLQRMADLPDHLQIWPGHGAGSACGKALGAVPTSTLGYERLVGWAFQHRDEASFVRAVLEDQPEPPAYFARMKRMNRDGPTLLGHLPEPGHVGNALLERALLEGTQVVDLRSTEAFAGGHVPGTLSIPLNRSFTNWAGSLLSYDEPLHLVSEDEAQARDAARDLALIGFDGVAGYVGPEALEYWESHKGGLGTAPVVSAEEAHRLQEAGALLVDVRARSEVAQGRPAGATHIHLGSLPDAADGLPRDRPVLVSCLTGARAGIGQSLLLARGFDAVKVGGGWQAWSEAGLPVERG
jgi:hydroxyacylglutathione hydrolase